MDFNISEVHNRIAAEFGDRVGVVCGSRRGSVAELAERSRALGGYLGERGLGVHRERTSLEPHRSGQDHLAVHLYDRPEYLEAYLGAFHARVAPFNVNHRYTAAEVAQVFAVARPSAVVYDRGLAPVLAQLLADRPEIRTLIEVNGTGAAPALPGAVEYERCLAEGARSTARPVPHPDDLYLLFTGGTTGMPKAVLWRQADIFVAGMGGWDPAAPRAEWADLDRLVASISGADPIRFLAAAPLFHGAGQWAAFQALLRGDTAVLPGVPDRRDPADLLGAMERERVNRTIIVGDAFGRPLLAELRRAGYDLGSLTAIFTGGVGMSAEVRAELLERLPGVVIHDTLGSSETGAQARTRATGARAGEPGRFRPFEGTCVLSEDRARVLPAGCPDLGWLGTAGRIPLGYLDDPVATARSFPVVGGTRLAVPGDRARHLPDGTIRLLGRDSVTINSGGEKIFAEEVEAAILRHPDVADVTVVGRPSDRWGSEVVAVVAARDGRTPAPADVLRVAAVHLARFKLPKQIVFVEQVRRSLAGKPDYAWARAVAVKEDSCVRS